MAEKPKANIPFPLVGNAAKKEEPKVEAKPAVEEFDEQQREALAAQLNQHLSNVVCKHEASVEAFAKGGLVLCGHCKKAFMHQTGQWVMFDRVLPEEWFR